MNKTKRSGFTLAELLVGLVIFIIVGFVLIDCESTSEKVKKSKHEVVQEPERDSVGSLYNVTCWRSATDSVVFRVLTYDMRVDRNRFVLADGTVYVTQNKCDLRSR